ncbi:MAG: multicomponent Na+:H+ antiporter subunit D [Paracoccaceae bacterium]|jgi:multicomponent Na+:H+ antiporter subunit D
MSTEIVHHTALTLTDHLPALQVLVTFVAAPLIVLIGGRRFAWPIAFIASAISLVIAALLLSQVLDGSIISYHMGGWAPPLGIEYRIDAANAFVLVLVTAISTLVLPFARVSVEDEVPKRHHALFYASFLLCLTGLLGVTITGDAFNVFVFLEISSLSTYVLIAQGAERDKRALTASYDYLIMGTIGATFFVIGLGFLYMATGTLNMADIAERIAEQGSSRTIRAAFAFIVVGIALKVAMYPLHRWLPNAYTFAPSAITAFLAATATKVAIYVLLRFMFSIFQPAFLFEVNTLEFIILPFAVVAMFAASFIAIFQSDFKRMLAYSSIAQIGYILLGIAFLTETGLTAAIVHLFNHGITKAALFMAVGAYVFSAGGSFYDDIQGLGRRLPWTSAAVVIGGLSLIGVPGTAGFVSKWVLVQAALDKGWWPVAMLIVASSLLAVIYVWRVIEVLYMKPALTDREIRSVPLMMLVPIWIAALSCIWFGLNTDMTLNAATAAARGLLAGTTGMH